MLCVTCLAVLAQKVEPGGSETCVTSSMTCLQSLWGGELGTVKKLKNKMKGLSHALRGASRLLQAVSHGLRGVSRSTRCVLAF